jgi:hypothetical protein
MENLYIKGTIKSPTFDFNYEKGELNITGRSHPEDVNTVYKPALRWLEKYIKNPKPITTVNFILEYYNTSSSKIILEIFRELKAFQDTGNNVIVNWHYAEADEDLRDDGEMFSDMVKLPIELVVLKEV